MTPAPAVRAARTVRLGRYRLLLELGEGGMARVFAGFSSGLGGFNKLVVLKVMKEELPEREASLSMFLAEARLAARMNHRNIVQTLEVGEDQGRYFICMEYLEGQTLARLLQKTGASPLPLAVRLELIRQVLDALVYMHAFTDPDGTPLRLVHRDISPNNIFVTFDGTAKVLDFGIAKAVGVGNSTQAGTFKGKLGYAAPEQILGNSEQRSDLFATGVLFWELLTYRRLSHNRTQQEIMEARMAGVDPDLMRKALGVPVELLQICTRAAAKRVEDRYGSAKEMRDALGAYVRANNLECSSEQLAGLLGDLYSEDREAMQRLIDQRMKQARLEDAAPGGGGAIPVAPAAWAAVNARTLTGNASTYVAPRAPSGKGKWITALLGVAALAGVAGRWFSQSTPPEPVPAISVARAFLIPRAVADTPKFPPLVTLKVAASPSDTEIYLDGALLDGNPFSGQFPKDSALRRLELHCLGRVTEARMIRLDQDLDLLMALQVDRSVTAAKVGPVFGALPKAAGTTTATAPGGAAAPNASAMAATSRVATAIAGAPDASGAQGALAPDRVATPAATPPAPENLEKSDKGMNGAAPTGAEPNQ